MNVGKLSYRKFDDGSVAFAGKVETLQADLQFTSRPPQEQGGQHSHEIVTNVGGRVVRIGQAYMMTQQSGEMSGFHFFNLVLDDPSFDKPIRVTAFPRDNDQANRVVRCDVVFSRPRAKRDQAPALSTAGGDDSRPGGVSDDEIPF